MNVGISSFVPERWDKVGRYGKMDRHPGLNERLAECAREARGQAQLLPAGPLRDKLLEKAQQYEAQISMNEWLQPPSHRSLKNGQR